MSMISVVLVTAQIACIALILIPVNTLFNASIAATIGLAIVACSTLLAIWALSSLRLNNFSVLPEPVSQGSLVRSGPYQFIRHPMYSAVIFACLGACISHGQITKWCWMVILCAVLIVKIRREETLLARAYTQYEDYQRQTQALVPFVY